MNTRKYSTAIELGYIIAGGLFLIRGVMGFFPVSLTTMIIEFIAVLPGTICYLVAVFGKREKGDEMSERCLHRSFYLGGITLASLLGILMVLEDLNIIHIGDVDHFVSLTIGLGAVMIGVFYLWQEKKGFIE